MQTPELEYNVELFNHIKNIRRDRKSYMMYDLEMLGEGAAGTTYLAYVKPESKFGDYPVVLKEQVRNRYCINEFNALRFLREKMLAGELPGYYIFLYGCFDSGGYKYFVIERADINLDDYMVMYDLSVEKYLHIFWHVANAVEALEAYHFNHGDLWSENVMIMWDPDQDHLDDEDKTFTIKIIDYDSAYNKKHKVTTPSYGGAEYFRKKFILGYDLSRFFDSLIYSHDSFIKKKTAHKRAKINRLKKLKKRKRNIVIPSMDDPDSSDEEFDRDNIIYPEEIVQFMRDLKPQDPNDFNDCPHMSGTAVKKVIEEYAEEHGYEL